MNEPFHQSMILSMEPAVHRQLYYKVSHDNPQIYYITR